MACFLIPTAEAIISTVITKIVKSKEDNNKDETTKFSHKINWLSNMLWGGSFLLAFEHIWHGELVPWYPFLTAMNNPEDKINMLHEMLTVGIAMSLIVTAIWIGMVLISSVVERKSIKIKKGSN